MENIVRPKIPQMPQNLSVQFICPSPKVLDFNEKRLYWASVFRVRNHSCPSAKLIDKKSPACLHTQESITSIFTMGQNSISLIIRIYNLFVRSIPKIHSMPLLVWLSFAELRGEYSSKAKGLWEWPLDYFRIEGQNFTGFWSISQLFYRLWKKEFDCTYCKSIFYTQSP